MEPFDLRNWPEFAPCDKPCVIDQITIDSRRIHSKNSLFVALTGSNFDGHDFVRQAFRQGAKFAIVRRDFPEQFDGLIRVDDPLRALQQIAKAYRLQRKAKVIAIAGSCGKTMLKDLLHKIVCQKHAGFASPESFNSQIGVALSLLKITDAHDIALIEAGVSKQGEMDHLGMMIRPDHVIITNTGSKRLGTTASNAVEILKILAFVPEGNWIQNNCGSVHACRSTYTIEFEDGTALSGTVQEGLSYVSDLIRIASSAAKLLGIEHHHIEKALASYVPEPMRIEVFKSTLGCTIINDTYSQDPMSCDVALRQMDNESAGRKIFLFGGLRPPLSHADSDMARIAGACAKHKVNVCILPHTETAHQLVSQLSLMSPHTEVIVCKDQRSALDAARRILKPNDVMLVKGAQKIPFKELIQSIEESPPNNQVIINLAVIQDNIEEIRSKVGKDVRIMVMVKALAYGTDDVRVAKFLKSCGIDILGVSYVDEGVAMRKEGVSQAIFALNAAEYEAEKAVKWDLEVGVSEENLIDALQKYAAILDKKVRVHIHVDTGMCRFGCRSSNVLPLAQKIASSPNLILEGIMTHFAAADDPDQDQFTLLQAKRLQDAIDCLETAGHYPRWRHASGSSGAIRFSFSQFNMIRIGLAVYGLHGTQATKKALNLRPAISLVSRIVGINECLQGDSVSYGRSHVVAQEVGRIAVLPIGYFDGLHRNYSGKGYCLIHGKKAHMVGRICMDYMMVDITDIPEAKIGDPVLLFGEDDNGEYLSPEELAQAGGSIVHELMACLGPRIRRFFIYDESLRPR